MFDVGAYGCGDEGVGFWGQGPETQVWDSEGADCVPDAYGFYWDVEDGEVELGVVSLEIRGRMIW